MESVAGLRCSALPNIPSVRIPSCFHSSRATRPQLSLSHSSLSLPRTFEGRPLHRPTSCMRNGSLHRGTENVPLTSLFPWDFGRIHCSKGEAGQTGKGSSSSQTGTNEDHQSQQIQDSVKCQQLGHLARHAMMEILKGYLWLTVNENECKRTYQIIHDYFQDVVRELQTAENHDVAVKILKAYEPLAAAYDGGDALQLVQSQLMKSLQALGKYGEASEYWLQLFKQKSKYLQNDDKEQYGLLWAKLTEVSNCLKKANVETTVLDAWLKNIGETHQSLKAAQGDSGINSSKLPD